MLTSERRRLLDKYRPLFLALSFLALYLNASAQTYNPSTCCTVSNKSYGAAQAVSTDGRSWFYDASNLVMRDYNGTTEVLSYLNLTKYRQGHFPIFVHTGGVLQGNGVWLGGHTLVYWFKDSTDNASLVRWYTDSTGNPGGPFYAVANNLSEGNAGLIKGNLALDNVNNTSDAQKNAASVALTNHTIDGNLNTLQNISNAALAHSSIGLSITATPASDISVITTPAALGSAIVANIPDGGTSSRGAITSTNWNHFNTKVDSVRISNDSVYNCVNGTCTLQSVIVAGGAVNSVNGTNASLVFSPTTGNVLGQVNPAFAFNWTGQHSFLSFAPIFSTLTTNGGVFYGSGTGQLLQSGAGTSGQIFQSNGGSAPTFFTPNATTVEGWLGFTPLTNALASTHIFVGNGSNVATDVAMSGDIGLSNTGVSTIQPNAVTTGKINNSAVTYAKMQAVSGAALLGSPTGGAVSEITLGTNLSFSGSTLNATGTGTDTSHAAGYNLGISRSSNKVTYFSTDTLEGFVGQILRSPSFASLSGWTNNGSATFTATGGVITASGGAGLDDFTNSLDYNYYTGADEWGFSAVLKTGTAAANVGMSIGLRSTNATVPCSMAVQFDGSNSAHAGRIYLRAFRGVNFVRVDSTTALSFTAGDKIEINVFLNRFSVTILAKDQTTNSNHVLLTHNFSLLAGSDVLPNTGHFSIFQHGGANEIDSAAINIYSLKYPAICVLGDSRLYGDYVGDYGYSYVQQLQSRYGSVVNFSKSGDKTGDILNRIPEALSTHARQYIYMAGINDIAQAVDTNTIKSNIAATNSALISQGAKVWYLLPWYSSVYDQTWLKNYIVRTYPNYIDTWTPSVRCPDCRTADSIHYTAVGNRILARATLDTNVLVGGRTRLPDSALVKAVGLWSANDSVQTVVTTTVDNQVTSDNIFVYDRKNKRLGIFPGNGPSSPLAAPAHTIDASTGDISGRIIQLNPASGGSMSMQTFTLFKTVNGLDFNNTFIMGCDNASLTDMYLGSGSTSNFHLFDRGGNDYLKAATGSLSSALTINGGSCYAGATNLGASPLQLNGGSGTGTGTPSDVVIGLPTTTGSGSTLQTITNRWWFKGSTLGLANKSNPNASAAIDLSGNTTQGFLPPVLTVAQRDAIASPADGLVIHNRVTDKINWYDSANAVWRVAMDSARSGPLFSQTQTVTVANSAVETSLVGTGVGAASVPANFLQTGGVLLINMVGIHSATGSPNITINVKLGGTTICTTGAVLSGSSTNGYFEARAVLTCYTTGSSGTIWTQGYYTEGGSGANLFPMANSSTSTINTTISNAVDITVTWGTASASNTITSTNFTVTKR